MSESSMRKVGRIKEDRISELPRNVQGSILCFLPLEDAVRTSVLSKKWRHCWTMMPHLIFDDDFADRIMDVVEYVSHEMWAYRFVSVVNKTILLHKGPILKFSLSVPRYQCEVRMVHDFIDQWILFLSTKGTKQIVIEDSELQDDIAHHLSSLDLTHLRLTRVWFPYKPTFERFTYLTILELFDATYKFGKHNILDCPVLEKLTLIICKGLYHTNFHAPNLKCLHQIYRRTKSEIPHTGLENITECSFMLPLIGTLMEAKTSNVVKYLGSLHKIQKFSIARKYLKYLAEGGCPTRLSKPLPYLKTLNVSGINFTQLSEVSCLLCMIRSAPNLCKLYISAEEFKEFEELYGETDLKNYQIEDCEDCTTINHLETVTFSYFKGLKAELELVKFVLAHSPLLKTMFIHRDKCIKKDAALIITEEILQYSRASTIAKIRHLKCCVDFEIDDFDKQIWLDYDVQC